VPAGVVSRHVGSFADLLPTVAALNHVPIGQAVQGISIAPILTGKPAAQRNHDHLYWEFYERGGWQAARQGRWKAVRQPMLTGPIQLYDLSRDLGETHDVAARHPAVVARMAAIMAADHVPDPHWQVVGKPED
jgi:arylsulfatase A-like enzyme